MGIQKPEDAHDRRRARISKVRAQRLLERLYVDDSTTRYTQLLGGCLQVWEISAEGLGETAQGLCTCGEQTSRTSLRWNRLGNAFAWSPETGRACRCTIRANLNTGNTT